MIFVPLAESGRRPFPATQTDELIYRVTNEPAPSLREHAPHAPDAVVDLVARCLATDPTGRPASASALLAELAEFRA